jgi:purine-binding chemotaxis protein CheW
MAGLVRRRAEQRALRRAADGKRTEYLAFVLAGETYAVKIHSIVEILKPPPLTEVPRAEASIIGVVSVRGRLVTVIDLRRRFRVPTSPLGHQSRILLADKGDELIGLLVDEVLQVYRLADTEIEPANVLGGDQPAHILGIGRPAGALLVLVDFKPILDA